MSSRKKTRKGEMEPVVVISDQESEEELKPVIVIREESEVESKPVIIIRKKHLRKQRIGKNV